MLNKILFYFVQDLSLHDLDTCAEQVDSATLSMCLSDPDVFWNAETSLGSSPTSDFFSDSSFVSDPESRNSIPSSHTSSYTSLELGDQSPCSSPGSTWNNSDTDDIFSELDDDNIIPDIDLSVFDMCVPPVESTPSILQKEDQSDDALSHRMLCQLPGFFRGIDEQQQQQFMESSPPHDFVESRSVWSPSLERQTGAVHQNFHQASMNKITNYANTPSLYEKQRGKPALTYVALIGKAILSSPSSRMVLSQIYDYITENYPFYRTTALAWRNAVRHNLSINDCFIKAGRTGVGRGYYWAVHPSCIKSFRNGDFSRRDVRLKVQKNQKATFVQSSTPLILKVSSQTARVQMQRHHINSLLVHPMMYHC